MYAFCYVWIVSYIPIAGDTMTVQDPVAMNLCAAVWAVTAYVVADLDDMLPRDNHNHTLLYNVLKHKL